MSGTPPIGPDGGMARVLVVLDLPLLVKLIMLTLKHGIWIVRTATTLEQVAASARAHPP